MCLSAPERLGLELAAAQVERRPSPGEAVPERGSPAGGAGLQTAQASASVVPPCSTSSYGVARPSPRVTDESAPGAVTRVPRTT